MTTLMVCTVGGHLQEALSLAPRLVGVDSDFVWVTWRTEQSESLLRDHDVVWIESIEPRQGWRVARQALAAHRQIQERDITAVVSTGAAVALSYLPVAAAAGVPSHYIECFTRTDGPSVTGRVLERLPGVCRYTHHRGCVNDRWEYRGSLLDGFVRVARPSPPRSLDRIVVTLGTMPYPFRRGLQRLVQLLPSSAEVLWQTGHTPTVGLGINAREWVPGQELADAVAEADLVIGHCGTGTTLTALEAGVHPVLIPREHSFGENVDDHQLPLADEVNERGLAAGLRVDELTEERLWDAASYRIERREQPPLIDLG